MRRRASRIDRAQRAALGTFTAVCVLVALVGGLRSLAPTLRGPLSLALAAGGLVGLALRFVAVRVAAWLARPLHWGLTAAGNLVSGTLLSLLYLALVWPYSALLVRLGRLESAQEPWPPPAASTGWLPVSTTAAEARRTRPGSALAGLTVRLGAAAALLRYLRDRPTAFLVPLVLLLLALGLFALLGNATGLGPLIYTLF